MLVYRCIKKFHCSQLKRNFPVGALVLRYENVTKLAIQMAPDSTEEINTLVADFEFDDPEDVTWFYGLQPAIPTGTSEFFTFVISYEEDIAGGGVDRHQGETTYFGTISADADFPPVDDRIEGDIFRVDTDVIDPVTLIAYTAPTTIMFDETLNFFFEIGGGGAAALIIGPAEDGTYDDGLFLDFLPTTPIGTPIDRFNELFLALVPPAAPSLDELSVADTGVNGNLSFGVTAFANPAGYTDVTAGTDGIGSLTDEDVNDAYDVTNFTGDLRQGIFNATTTIDGVLNDDVPADGINFPANAFGEADRGELRIFLNDDTVPLFVVDLTVLGVQAVTVGNVTISISASTDATFPSGVTFALFQHRTGTWSIAPAGQRTGWNFFRVVHRTVVAMPATDITTNYVEWVVDDDTTAITASAQLLNTLVMAGSRFLTGVEYHASGTCRYTVTINDAYRNAYAQGNATTFGGSTDLTIGSLPLPVIGGAESFTKSATYTNLLATLSPSDNKILDEAVTARVSVVHPLTADNLVNGGAATISDILLYNVADTGTVLLEDFTDESFRLEANAFNLQADVAANTWVSATDRTAGSALVVYDETLTALANLANGGDFTVAAIANGPAGNVDYSGLAGNLEFYRSFNNNTGGSRKNFNLIMTGTGTILTSLVGLGANANLFVEVKLPGSTGWLVITPAFDGMIADGDGCLGLGVFDSTLDATNPITFGTSFVNNTEDIVIRITADAAWTGEITSMQVVWT